MSGSFDHNIDLGIMSHICVVFGALCTNSEHRKFASEAAHGDGVYEIVVKACYGNKKNEWRETK